MGALGTLGGVAEGNQDAVITLVQCVFTPLSAFSFMAFSLLYIPCLATIGAIRQETNSWKWPVTISVITLVTAYAVCFVIYNVGVLLGFG